MLPGLSCFLLIKVKGMWQIFRSFLIRGVRKNDGEELKRNTDGEMRKRCKRERPSKRDFVAELRKKGVAKLRRSTLARRKKSGNAELRRSGSVRQRSQFGKQNRMRPPRVLSSLLILFQGEDDMLELTASTHQG